VSALALAAGLALLVGGPSDAKLVYVQAKTAVIVYVGHPLRQPIALTQSGPPRFSGDGRLLSIGGWIVGRVRLPADEVVWAPTGERAAVVTKAGGVEVWTPRGGRRAVVPSSWGAQSVAWSTDGALALGRASPRGIWVWRVGLLRRVVGAVGAPPMPFGWRAGRVLWWAYPNSASLAADGVAVYEGRRRVADALMYPDYVTVCGNHLAVAAGGDRYSTYGKHILFDNRDVSRDRSRSWVSPSCRPDGRLVAAAGRSTRPRRFGREARAVWQLLPGRRQLTHPPAGWTDEAPHLLPDGSVLFVRTRQTPRTTHGRIELLRRGRLTELAGVVVPGAVSYYGHYDWASRIAVWP
jgi:hypothetical protein